MKEGKIMNIVFYIWVGFCSEMKNCAELCADFLFLGLR